MQIFELGSFPIEQVTKPDILMEEFASWFVPRDFPTRIFAYSRAFNMQPALDRLREQQVPIERARIGMTNFLRATATTGNLDNATRHTRLREELQKIEDTNTRAIIATLLSNNYQYDAVLAPEPASRELWEQFTRGMERSLWRIPWMKEMARFYRTMEQQAVRSASYLITTWEPTDVSQQALATTLRNTFKRPVTIRTFLPSIIEGPYEEHNVHLKPLIPGLPWLAVLHSYDMQDVWDIATLHPLLGRKYDVSIAIDIITLNRNKAQRRAEMAYNAANLAARDHKLLDTRAERVTGDARAALGELHHQTLHEVQIAIVVAGATRDDLESNVAEAKDLLTPRLRFMRSTGCQAEVLKLFSTEQRNRIDAPWKPRTQLSYALGCMAGVVTYHRPSNTNGLFLGIDTRRRAPIFMDLFKNNQAAHITILGKTGYGKTVFINILAERAATTRNMQVIGIDAFENGFRVANALQGAQCYRIGMEQTINILDIVYGQDVEAGWLALQIGHVIGQLSLLMGTPAKNHEGKDIFKPREFTPEERGVIDLAIGQVYATHLTTPDTPVDQTPILSDLIVELDSLNDPIANDVTTKLRYLMFGRQDVPNIYDKNAMNIQGRAFNGHTTVDWNFQSDVIYYDFSRVAEIYRPFYYLQAIGAINRYIRRKDRDRSREIFVEIDEFGYASQVDAVARLAVEICKTARKYRTGIVLVDQNPHTFLATESGRAISENAAARIYFHLEDMAARDVGEADSKLTEEQVEWLTRAQTGECLAVIRDDTYQIAVDSHPMEMRAFLNS